MDETFNEIDSFTAKMQKKLNKYEADRGKLANDETILLETEDSLENLKSNSSKVDDHEESISEDEEVVDEDYDLGVGGHDDDEQLRKSISRFLDVDESLRFVANEESQKGDGSRLNKRLNRISAFYENDDQPRHTAKSVLSSKDFNAKVGFAEPAVSKRLPLNDRLKRFASAYYPTTNEEQEIDKNAKPVQEIVPNEQKKEAVITGFAKKVATKDCSAVPPSVKSKIYKFEPVKIPTTEAVKKMTPQFNVNKLVPAVKNKTSVSDLKKLFENKSVDASVKEKAPELLSVRERAKLFEYKRMEEEKARLQQYYPTHRALGKEKRLISPSASPGKDETFKKPKSMDGLDALSVTSQSEVIVENTTNSKATPESICTYKPEDICNSSFGSQVDATTESEKNSSDEQAAIDLIDKEFETISKMDEDEVHGMDDLTFTALDKNFEAPKQFLTTLSASQLHLSLNEEDPQFQRSSTQSDMSNSLQSESGVSLEAVAPPNQLYMYENQDEPTMAPQMKTISFYRRQQQEANQNRGGTHLEHESSQETPGQVLYYKQNLPKENQMDCESFIEECHNKIDDLYLEVTGSKQIGIAAAKALELSMNSPNLINSDGRVEAERLLLISEVKQKLDLAEITRLKAMIREPEKHLKKNSTKAFLAISKIKLPLRNEFVITRSKGKAESTHHFMCLITHGSKKFCSEVINTDSNASSEILEFKFALTVNDLNSNFIVLIQLYELELSKVEKPKKRGLTLAKSIRMMNKNTLTKSPKPNVPGSPVSFSTANTRTHFKEVGRITLSLDVVHKPPKYFTFENSNNITSPLSGFLTMKVALSVIHENKFHGFFDYQDNETSYWNLRWFKLDGSFLHFWRFQEDCSKRPSLGKIDLKKCVNPVVGFLKPEHRCLCARPNTIVLVTMEPQEVSNATKLVVGGVIHKSTSELHFISSAMKEDAAELCEALNQVLKDLRTWEVDTIPKYSTEEFDRLLGSL